MEIKTKYNLGDKFYRISNNKPIELRIKSLYIAVGESNVRESYTLVGEGYRYDDVTSHALDTEYYQTKSALMLAMFPDLFKEAKNVLVLNEEGGEQ